MILILDYGSQYTQLIARRIREKKVFSQVLPFHAPIKKFIGQTEGIILSGGPASVYEGDAPHLPSEVFQFKVPILGICYGAQLLVHVQNGQVEATKAREFGGAYLTIFNQEDLFFGLENKKAMVWMSHGDKIVKLPPSFEVIANSDNSPFAAFRNLKEHQYGVLFHPEVTHTLIGTQVIENFIFRICGAKPTWTVEHFISQQLEQIRSTVGKNHVLCALSGGVDSSVLALLLHKAIGDQLTAIFVDTGLLRSNERQEVEREFKSHFHIDLRVVDASSLFFNALTGINDPEQKRKMIGKLFIDVFEKEGHAIRNVKYLAQGTLYPDVIESVALGGPSQTIKSHHNVGGLPEKMHLSLIEPLRELFKDEVREIGKELGLPDRFIHRHPFPGPGMAVRVIGEVTKERVTLLQAADAIFINELERAGLYHQVWQAFSILLPVKSVGVMGDIRTYENVCVLRAVKSQDGMTADWAELPHDFLAKCSNRIINEVRGINRVVYDISSKPPSTIEWE